MLSESDLREQLATCTRIFAMQGMIGLYGHVSVYSPEDRRVFISPGMGSDKAAMQAAEVLVMNLDGQIIEGAGQIPAEWPIHTALHRERPDAVAVAHLHSPYATLYAIAKREYRPVTLKATFFVDGVPLYTEPQLIKTAPQGARVAALMRGKRAALLRAHGIVAVGGSLPEVLQASLILEDDTRSAMQAAALGEIGFLSPDECRAYANEGDLRRRARRMWDYFARLEARWDRQPGTGGVSLA